MCMLGPVNAIEKGTTRSNKAVTRISIQNLTLKVVQEAKTEHKMYEKSAGLKPTVNGVMD